MNLLLLFEGDRLVDDRFRVGGQRARHIRQVIGAESGQSLRVGLLEGPTGTATVLGSVEDRVDLECHFEAGPPPRPMVDLILAVPRPKSLRKLLPEVTAMGVDRLVLLRTWRVAKPYLTAKILEPEQLQPLLHEGLMQGVSTRMPKVLVEPLFKPFIEDRAPSMFAGGQRLVGHPRAKLPMSSLRLSADERVTIAIGPEGGLIPYEVEAFQRAGFQPVTMGERVLRVETACVALLAQIGLLRALEGG